MRSVVSQKPWLLEPWVLPIPWLNESAASPSPSPMKLKVAVMWDDGVVTPHPPVKRALQEIVQKLKQDSSIEVLDWTPWDHEYAWDLTVRRSTR